MRSRSESGMSRDVMASRRSPPPYKDGDLGRRSGSASFGAETALGHPRCDLRSRGEAQLVQHVLDVGVDGALADHELSRDLWIRETACDELSDLELPLRERSGRPVIGHRWLPRSDRPDR